MISIGLVSGPNSSILEEQCRLVIKLFEAERKNVATDVLVNVVFHSPLSIKKANFEGMTAGAYSKNDRMILVAIAVPESVTGNQKNEVVNYIKSTIHEAADFGIDFLIRNGINVNRNVFHKFIDTTLLKI